MKSEKVKVLRLARSIARNNPVSFPVTEGILDLLMETSMIRAFDIRFDMSYEDERVVKALRGCREKHRINEKILRTLDEAPVPVYYLKEWQELWDGRFSSDVDIGVQTRDVESLHEFLVENNFLARPEEYIPPTPLLEAEQGISQRLQDLPSLFYLERQDYTMAKLLKEFDETQLLKEIETLEENLAGENYLNDVHRFLRDQRRDATSNAALRNIHDLMVSRVEEMKKGRLDETLLEKLDEKIESLITLREMKSDVGLDYNRSDRLTERRSGEFEYNRGAQFLEVVTLNETEASDGIPLEVTEAGIQPEDNFVLHASHFCKNIVNVFTENHFNGFLKCLIDGAVLFNRRNMSVEIILHRADELRREDETRYYLGLLKKYGFVDIGDVNTDSVYIFVDDESLLFNERTTHTKLAALMIKADWMMRGKRVEHKEPPWVS